MRPDPEYRTDGGWKVHLTISPHSYQQRATSVRRWLSRNFNGTEGMDWKHLLGGDQHKKDFTVYLGSYATMMVFVNNLENDSIVKQLSDFNGGSADRIVGHTGKHGARFDPCDRAGRVWLYGWNGIPFALEGARLVMGGKRSREDAAERPRMALRAIFGDYFLPRGID